MGTLPNTSLLFLTLTDKYKSHISKLVRNLFLRFLALKFFERLFPFPVNPSFSVTRHYLCLGVLGRGLLPAEYAGTSGDKELGF